MNENGNTSFPESLKGIKLEAKISLFMTSQKFLL